MNFHRLLSHKDIWLLQNSLLPILTSLALLLALGTPALHAQTITTLVPSSYVTSSGSSGGQPVASSVDILDESGTTNTWSKYVEFQTTSSANYGGYQVFTLPTSISPRSVTAIQVKVNYQGPDTATQTWTWQLFNWTTSSYSTVGTNAGAPSWGAWTILTFNTGGTLANYVRASDGQMRVQLLSNNHADNCDIDYEAVVVTSSAQTVSVSISPLSASMQTGNTQQFTATVTGSSNTLVNWQVNGITGGTSTVGTVSTSGLYTAPATVPSPATVNVTAVSQADTTKSASASITVTSVPVVNVAISPVSSSVQVNQTQQFTATVTGSSNTNVTWQVNGVTGGSSTTGTVTTSGLYNAPASVPSPANVNTTAVSQADNTKSATAVVTVTASSGSGINYYVSTTGSDSNSGTGTSNSQSWRTIQHAVSSVHPGDTINVLGGVYGEIVTINASGSSSAGYITLQNYAGQNAVVDGTGLAINGQNGLINISGQSYVKVVGLEVRNYTSTTTAKVPVGIWITGANSYIQILNNHIHNIKTTASGCNANALGLGVYGTNATSSINNLTISGNELDHLTTGCSESMSLNGNVQYWSVTNNLIHDNNNIGIDAIGFEGTSSDPNTDQARDGLISGNTVYSITSYGNPAYGNQYAADGIYVDGGTRITVERNMVHNTDFAVEVASEHKTRTASYVTVRNNLIYNNNAAGITIGGYDSLRGGTDHCNFVNNSLYNNDTKRTGAGEFQIQYYATSNVFKNNILYAGSQGLFIYNYTNSESNPADVDHNLYYLPAGASSSNWTWNSTNFTGYSSYQSGSGKDAHSPFSNPLYVNLSTPDLHVSSSSQAVNAGINLGATVDGTVDFAGNPRVQGSSIDIGAYEQ